ncbi:MAG: hypothetical protein RR595_02585 [Lysinibacillus sp.]
MQWKLKIISVSCLSILLTGCGDRLTEIKEAASGINAAADEAAKAMSQDVHSVRAITIDYQGASFTINELFKTILRDVRWRYDEETEQLQVEGTWLDPLFSEQQWNDVDKKQLAENGKVTVVLPIQDNTINSAKTTVRLQMNKQLLIDDEGDPILQELYDTYLSKK